MVWGRGVIGGGRSGRLRGPAGRWRGRTRFARIGFRGMGGGGCAGERRGRVVRRGGEGSRGRLEDGGGRCGERGSGLTRGRGRRARGATPWRPPHRFMSAGRAGVRSSAQASAVGTSRRARRLHRRCLAAQKSQRRAPGGPTPLQASPFCRHRSQGGCVLDH